MKAKIKHLEFQHNGVAGRPFYHCFVEINDDKKRNMIVTFETAVNDTQILWSSCRAVAIDEPEMKWRGDNIAACINDVLDKQMIKNGGTIYDCRTAKIEESNKIN